MICVTEEQILLLRTWRRRAIPLAFLLLFVAALVIWMIVMPIDFRVRSGAYIFRAMTAKVGAAFVILYGYGYLFYAVRIVFGACLDLRQQAVVQKTGVVASTFSRENVESAHKDSEKCANGQFSLVIIGPRAEQLFCDSSKSAQSSAWLLHVIAHMGVWITSGYFVDDSVCNWAQRQRMFELSKEQHRQYTIIAAKHSHIVLSCCPVNKKSTFIAKKAAKRRKDG